MMQMVDKLVKFLRREKASAAEIRGELARLIEADLPAAQRALGEAEARRKKSLLEGSDRDREAALAGKQSAADQVEALGDVKVALEKKLEAAQAAEREAELKQAVTGAQRASDRGVEILGRYEKLAREIADLMAELVVCDQVVRESWAASAELSTEKVSTPARRNATGAHHIDLPGIVVLPASDGFGPAIWPPSRDPERAAEVEEQKRGMRARIERASAA